MAATHVESDTDDEFELLKSDVVATPNKTNFTVNHVTPAPQMAPHVARPAKLKSAPATKPAPAAKRPLAPKLSAPKPPLASKTTSAPKPAQAPPVVPQKRTRNADAAEQVFPKTKRWIHYGIEPGTKKASADNEVREPKGRSTPSTIQNAFEKQRDQTQRSSGSNQLSPGPSLPLEKLQQSSNGLNGYSSGADKQSNGHSRRVSPAVVVHGSSRGRSNGLSVDGTGDAAARAGTPDSRASRMSHDKSRSSREPADAAGTRSNRASALSKPMSSDHTLVAINNTASTPSTRVAATSYPTPLSDPRPTASTTAATSKPMPSDQLRVPTNNTANTPSTRASAAPKPTSSSDQDLAATTTRTNISSTQASATPQPTSSDHLLVTNGWQVPLSPGKRLFVIPTTRQAKVMEVMLSAGTTSEQAQTNAHASGPQTENDANAAEFTRQQMLWKSRANDKRAYEVIESPDRVRWIPLGPDVVDETAQQFTLERALNIDSPKEMMTVDGEGIASEGLFSTPASEDTSEKASERKNLVEPQAATSSQDSVFDVDTIMTEPLVLPEESDSSYHDDSDDDGFGSDDEKMSESAMKTLQASFGLSTSLPKKSSAVDTTLPRAKRSAVHEPARLDHVQQKPNEPEIKATAPKLQVPVVRIAVDLSHDPTGLEQYDEDLLISKLRRGGRQTRSNVHPPGQRQETERQRGASPELGATADLLRRSSGGSSGSGGNRGSQYPDGSKRHERLYDRG